MTIPYTQTKALLAQIATSLSAEASTAGNANLSTALSSVATEITDSILTEEEFYGHGSTVTTGTPPNEVTTLVQKGSAAQIWSQALEAAASAIRSKIDNTVEGYVDTIQQKQTTIAEKQTTIAEKQTIIASETVTIDNHMNRIQSVVEDITTTCSSGPHFRTAAGTCSDGHEGELARAMMVLNLKQTNKLNDVIQEIENPTPIGHLPIPHR